MNDIKWWNEDEPYMIDTWCNGGCFDCDGEPCSIPDGMCDKCGSERLFISANQIDTPTGVWFGIECRDCERIC